VLFVSVLCATSALGAPGNSQADLVRSLNNRLLEIHGELQQVRGAAAAGLRAQAAPIIDQRAAALSALIERDPAQALQLAFSPDLAAAMREAFPQKASRFESHGIWQAPIEYYILDDPTMTVRRSVLRMLVAQENLDIYFGANEPPGLRCGAILKVEGVRVGNRVAAAGGSVTGYSVAAAGCSTTGQQDTAVLLVTFPGITPSATPQEVYDVFFATSGRSVDGFWKDASYGQAWATGNVFGWYTLSQSYTCDQYTQMRDAAIAAADVDVYFPNYRRVFIVFPNPGGCAWAGLGTLGCSTLSSPGDGSFTASTSWVLANYFTSRDQGVKLSTHEGGHNLTLHHASSRDFGAEALGALGAAGTLGEYGDVFSTMGSWNLGHYAAPHKLQLNWIASGTNFLTVETNGTYALQPIETNPPGLQALKVRRGTGNNAWLWVEYRQPIGSYDSTLGSQVFTGALIHYQDSTTGTHTHLLDFTPETSSWTDPALAASKSWTDPYSNVTIAVQSAAPTALGVNVTFGPVPCVEANPTVAISPANPTAQAGNNVNYTVTVTNNDSSVCAAGNFDLSSTLPSSWATPFAATPLNLSPGQAASTTMTKSVPSGTLPGTYAVNAIATRGTNSGTGNANCTVVVPPSAVVSVPNSIYAPRSTVPMTAMVISGGNPAAGASVVFTLNKPGGKTATKTVAADSGGRAVWSYRLGPKDPNGTYSVSATVTYNSLTGTSNMVNFTVQ